MNVTDNKRIELKLSDSVLRIDRQVFINTIIREIVPELDERIKILEFRIKELEKRASWKD